MMAAATESVAEEARSLRRDPGLRVGSADSRLRRFKLGYGRSSLAALVVCGREAWS